MNSFDESARSKLNRQIEAFLSEGGEITAVPTRKSNGMGSTQKAQWNKQIVEKPKSATSDQ
ncbi:hypothetical protein [Pseudomonas sp. Gutcm_11s]|uniref:hypothetical protein n=1 Tax=Pseudomonas sp. Gutcm_11s TaxID=3026088 RepID=UPI003FCF686A